MKENLNDLIIRIVKESGEIEISKLIEKIKLSYQVNHDLVAKKIYFLNNNILEIVEPRDSQPTFIKYLLSSRSLWFWNLTLLVVSTLPVIFCVNNSPFIYLRYLLTSIYVLYLPGFTLVETLYPKKDDLDSFERLGLSIGLSIALVIGIGFLLNLLPYDIELKSTAISLALFTEGFGFLALIRKYQLVLDR